MEQRLCNQLYGHVEFLERLCIDQNLQSLFLISQQDGSTFLKQATKNFMMEQAGRTTQLISDMVKNPDSPLYSIDKTFQIHYSPTERKNALCELLRGNDIDNKELKFLLYQESFITEKLLQYYQATLGNSSKASVQSTKDIEKEIMEKYQIKMENKINTLRVTIENTIRNEYESKFRQKEVNIRQELEKAYVSRRTELEQQYALKFAELENNKHFSTTFTNQSFSTVPEVTMELRKDIEESIKPRLMEEARSKAEKELREKITKEIKAQYSSKYSQKHSHDSPAKHSSVKSYKEIRKIYGPQIEAEISNAVDSLRESIAATAIDSMGYQAEQNARAKIFQYEVPKLVEEEVKKARRLIEEEKNIELQRRQIAADAAQREAEFQLHKAEEMQLELTRKRLSLESEIEELKKQSKSKLESALRKEIEESLRSKIEAEAEQRSENRIRSQIESKIREELEKEIKVELETKLRPKIESELRCKLAENEARNEFTKQKELERQIRMQLEAEYASKVQRLKTEYSKAKPQTELFSFESKLNIELLKQREELESQFRNEMEKRIAEEVHKKEQMLSKKHQLDLIKQRADIEDEIRNEFDEESRLNEKKQRREIRIELEDEMNEKMKKYKKQLRAEYDRKVAADAIHSMNSNQSMKSVASSDAESDLRQLIECELRAKIEKEVELKLKSQIEEELRYNIEKELRPIIEYGIRSELEREYKLKLKRKLQNYKQKHSEVNKQIPDEELKLRKEIEDEIKYQFERVSQDPRNSSLRSEIERELRKEFEAVFQHEKELIERNLQSQIEQKLREQIRNELEANLRSKIQSELESKLRVQIRSEYNHRNGESKNKMWKIREEIIEEIREEIHTFPQSPIAKRLRREFEDTAGEEILELFKAVSEALSISMVDFTRSEFISRTKRLASEMIAIREVLSCPIGSLKGSVSELVHSNDKLSAQATQTRALLARQSASIDKLKVSIKAWVSWAKKLYEKTTGKCFISQNHEELRNAIYSTN